MELFGIDVLLDGWVDVWDVVMSEIGVGLDSFDLVCIELVFVDLFGLVLLVGCCVVVVCDVCFFFIYFVNLDCLCCLGVELLFFLLLVGELLLVCDVLWLFGGYLELYV